MGEIELFEDRVSLERVVHQPLGLPEILTPFGIEGKVGKRIDDNEIAVFLTIVQLF